MRTRYQASKQKNGSLNKTLKRNRKPERKPIRQSERIKNKKLGLKLSSFGNGTKAQIKSNSSIQPQSTSQITINNTNNDVIVKQKQYYNEIATDNNIKTQINSQSNLYNKDKYGNLDGNNFDLAKDLGFSGKLIAILQLYVENEFNFKLPESALADKGFQIHRWIRNVPKIDEFKYVLNKSCQLWIVSTSNSMISDEHLEVIKQFFDSGKGVYIWGDNEPYYADANKISKYLFDVCMHGNLAGYKVVNKQIEDKKAGLVPHLINTGIDYLFEGVTIATIDENDILEPVVYGSADNLVVAAYNRYGKRAIIDGGFTRLYINWDTAGTGRYVKNAAAFLANIEYFG